MPVRTRDSEMAPRPNLSSACPCRSFTSGRSRGEPTPQGPVAPLEVLTAAMSTTWWEANVAPADNTFGRYWELVATSNIQLRRFFIQYCKLRR
jgi:hypothetical protein